MVTVDVKAIAVGASKRAAMLDTKGHILADLVLHRREKSVFIETDTRTLNCLVDTLNRYIIMEDVTLTDVSNNYGTLSLYGLEAKDYLSDEAIVDAVASGGWIAHREPIELNRYDIWLPVNVVEGLCTHFHDSNLTEISDKTYEVLRVECRDPSWGSELTEATLLPEAEIPDIVSYTKGCYVGQEIIARLHARGHTNWVLRQVLFSYAPDQISAGSIIYIDGEDKEVARITSVAQSQNYNSSWLALAYVRTALVEAGSGLSGKVVGAEGNSESVIFSVLAVQ
jgi:folate-binding protein YgfZ